MAYQYAKSYPDHVASSTSPQTPQHHQLHQLHQTRKMDPPFPFGREYNSTPTDQSFARPSPSRSQSLYSVGNNYSNTFGRPNPSRPAPELTLTRLSSQTILKRDLRVSNSLPPPLLPTPPSSDFDIPPECLPTTPTDHAIANESFFEPALPHPVNNTPPLSNITTETMALLRSSREGSYIVHDTTPAAFLAWQDRHPELLESDAKYEYDGLAERMIIKCMAGHLHDSPTIFFVRRVGDEVRDAGRVCRRQLQIASTTGELVLQRYEVVIRTDGLQSLRGLRERTRDSDRERPRTRM